MTLRGIWWRWITARRRWARGFAYATDTMTQTQACDIMTDCEAPADYYVLAGMSTEGVTELLLEDYRGFPDLRDRVADACAYVARRWKSHDDYVYEAEMWARDRVVLVADADGIRQLHDPDEGED